MAIVLRAMEIWNMAQLQSTDAGGWPENDTSWHYPRVARDVSQGDSVVLRLGTDWHR